MRTRKLEEIRKMELAKEKLAKELIEWHRQLEEEKILNDRILRMREENDEKMYEIKEIERQRRGLLLQQDIDEKQREFDNLQKRIFDERRMEQEMAVNESQFKDYDKKLI